MKSIFNNQKKNREVCFWPFILIKSTGGYITFEDSTKGNSNWFFYLYSTSCKGRKSWTLVNSRVNFTIYVDQIISYFLCKKDESS